MKPILQVIPNGSEKLGFRYESHNYKIIHTQPHELVRPALKALFPPNAKWNFKAGKFSEKDNAYVSFLETEVNSSH